MIKLPGTPKPFPPEKVTKLDAARRQLATAITLWFKGADTVSIYSLSHAAYEVIHNFTRPKRGRKLLFDSLVIKDEYRREFNTLIRNPANFFKHANRDKSENPTIEFHPEMSEMFFMYSILGIEHSKIPRNIEESAFIHWYCLNHPEHLTKKGREVFTDLFPVDALNEIRGLTKKEFFQAYLRSWREAGL